MSPGELHQTMAQGSSRLQQEGAMAPVAPPDIQKSQRQQEHPLTGCQQPPPQEDRRMALTRDNCPSKFKVQEECGLFTDV